MTGLSPLESPTEGNSEPQNIRTFEPQKAEVQSLPSCSACGLASVVVRGKKKKKQMLSRKRPDTPLLTSDFCGWTFCGSAVRFFFVVSPLAPRSSPYQRKKR
jgi:hypothetical protein